MDVEINKNFVKTDTDVKFGRSIVMVAPPVDEDYWIFRAKLFKDQAVVAFPKFSGIAIGFAQEEDWNTNLPCECQPEVIFNHIKHNKKYSEISNEKCLEALKSIRVLCRDQLGHGKFDSVEKDLLEFGGKYE